MDEAGSYIFSLSPIFWSTCEGLTKSTRLLVTSCSSGLINIMPIDVTGKYHVLRNTRIVQISPVIYLCNIYDRGQKFT